MTSCVSTKQLNQQKLDTNLYQIDSITWALTDNVHEINTKNLMLLERKYPGIMKRKQKPKKSYDATSKIERKKKKNNPKKSLRYGY